MAKPNRANFSFADFNGKTATAGLHCGVIDDPASLNAIVAALKGASNAAILNTALTLNQVESDTATDADYENCKDKAILQFFADTTGEYSRIGVPAPVKAMFMSNQSEIDPANPLSAALITAIIANGTTNSGAPITSFIKGWRTRVN